MAHKLETSQAMQAMLQFKRFRNKRPLASVTRLGLLAVAFVCALAFVKQEAQAQEKIRKKFANHHSLREDGADWSWEGVERTIAVGDLHGDFDAFVEILRQTNLVDSTGHWTGGKTHLVLQGDLVGGREGSRYIQDLIMNLEIEAKAAGGAVHALLGNHDLLVAKGEFDRIAKKELEAYSLFDGEKAADAIKKAYTKGGRYADWMASRNEIVRINGIFFVHAGVDGWGYDNSPAEINSTARAWIRYWQGRRVRPPNSTSWTVGLVGQAFAGDIGPAWHRGFKVTKQLLENPDVRPEGAPRRKHVRNILELWDGSRMVLGHAPTPDNEIYLEHPYYGEYVVAIDTRISDKKHDKIRVLEFNAEGEMEILELDPPAKMRPVQATITRGLRCQAVFR